MRAPNAALILFLITLSGCRGAELGPRGPRLDLEAELPPPTLAPHGFLRYTGGVRLERDDLALRERHIPGTLEGAIRRYRDAQGRELRLVALLHRGSPAYYRRIRQFLAPAAVIISEDARGSTKALGNPRRAKDGLISQASGLPPGTRWRRGDLDWTAIEAALTEAGISPERLRRPAIDEPGTEATDSVLELHLIALSLVAHADQSSQSKRRPKGLWKLSAEEFRRQRPAFVPAEDYALIYRRDDAAIAVLDRLLANQNSPGPIALVYGAAHGHDLAERILSRGFREFDRAWLPAWPLRSLAKHQRRP